jgi:hypothetical protein
LPLSRHRDKGKKINGRKRFIVTDTLGLLVAVVVLAASWQDRDGAKSTLLAVYAATPIRHVFADQGFAGKLVDWARTILKTTVEIVRKPAEQVGFAVHPRRWVVERTLAWLTLGVPQDEFVRYDSETVMHVTVCRRRPGPARRNLYAGRNTTWTLLHNALNRRLPADALRTGTRVTGLTGEYGRPLLRFADGDVAPADLVVFADGRSSIGRRLLDPDRQLRYAGYVAHRGQATTIAPGLRDFLRFAPSPHRGMQFNVAPIPGGADWTFYLGATPAQYTDFFGASPTHRVFALPQHITPAARLAVDASAERYLPDEKATLVHSTVTRMAAPVMDIDPPTRMLWPVGDGHAVLLGDALAPAGATHASTSWRRAGPASPNAACQCPASTATACRARRPARAAAPSGDSGEPRSMTSPRGAVARRDPWRGPANPCCPPPRASERSCTCHHRTTRNQPQIPAAGPTGQRSCR